MAILEELPEIERQVLESLECPVFETQPWVKGPPLRERRVAIISTAGLHRQEDRPFTFDPGDYYRVIPGNSEAKDLVMSHVSTNFDRSGFQQDWNVVFPLDQSHVTAFPHSFVSLSGCGRLTFRLVERPLLSNNYIVCVVIV